MSRTHLNPRRLGTQPRPVCWAALLLCWAAGHVTVHGQEALRASLAGEAASRARKISDTQRPYNVKAGPISVRFGAGLGFEYNDNIAVNSTGAQEDFIIRPSASMAASWPVTEYNQINFSASFGYQKYINNPQFDTFYIQASPDTGLSFDVFIGDVRINLHDRFSYQQNPLGQGSLSGGVNNAGNNNAAGFATAHNTVGISADWDLNKLTVSLGYDRHNTFYLGTGFSQLDTTSDFFYSRAAFAISQSVSTGIEATLGLTSYDQHTATGQNDSQQFTIGPFVNWRLSEFLQTSARAGYLTSSYRQTGANANSSSTPSYYGNLSINHTLNSYIEHQLQVGQSVQQGISSDSVSVFSVTYGINWRAFRLTSISPSVSYEHGKEAGLNTSGQTFDRVSASIGFNYRITQKLGATLNYSYTSKTANVSTLNYTANVVALNFNYAF